MLDPLLTNVLKTRGYETADPATEAEIKRNDAIASFDRLVAANIADQPSATVLKLRAGGRR